MGGILARPSWFIRISQVLRIFFPSFNLARPRTNCTTTPARSTGLPPRVLTSMVSAVIGGAACSLNSSIKRNETSTMKSLRALRISRLSQKGTARAAATRDGSSDVRQEETRWLVCGSGNGFGGEVTTAHRTLHRGRPSRASPVAREEDPSHFGCCGGKHRLHARTRRVGGAQLFDDVRAFHLC